MLLTALAAALALASGAAAAQPDFAALVRSQAPAVVSIAAAYSIPPVVPDVPHDEYFAEFLLGDNSFRRSADFKKHTP